MKRTHRLTLVAISFVLGLIVGRVLPRHHWVPFHDPNLVSGAKFYDTYTGVICGTGDSSGGVIPTETRGE